MERELKDATSRCESLEEDNKAKAARLLGITRPALYRRMESLGMTEEH